MKMQLSIILIQPVGNGTGKLRSSQSASGHVQTRYGIAHTVPFESVLVEVFSPVWYVTLEQDSPLSAVMHVMYSFHRVAHRGKS